jgi:hypothetical protein
MSFTACFWTSRTQLNELLADDRLTLARDAEQTHRTAQEAAGVVLEHRWLQKGVVPGVPHRYNLDHLSGRSEGLPIEQA